MGSRKALETLQLAYDQMKEDREKIKASYDKFAAQIDTLNDYAVNGQNINKCLELLTKQTAQLLELAKLQSATKKDDDEGFSTQEQTEIFDTIGVQKLQIHNGSK